ncbi:MAG TPA: hypothetical protein VGG29_14145 [Caulobacteraceae bacterium]
MFTFKTALATGAAVAVLAGGALALGPSASADVACNRWGECWHVHDRLAYPGGVGIVWHSDAWAARHHAGRWRLRQDASGRGYYRNGMWIAF